MMNRHLNDAEISELLAGNEDENSRAHLRSCERCRAELDTLRESVGNLHELGLLWAEQEAPRRIRVPAHRWERWPLQPVGIVAAALMVLCVAFFGWHTRHTPANAAPDASATAPAYQATLEEDNQLMMAIDRELSAQVVPQVPVQDLRAATVSRHRRSAARLVN